MSADELRRAAALMRERAEAATPGRWEFVADGIYVGAEFGDEGWLSYDHLVVETDEDDVAQADGGHIASWHPAVALAVADWLDGVAGRVEVKVSKGGNESAVWSHEIHALTVARAYLGEPSC